MSLNYEIIKICVNKCIAEAIESLIWWHNITKGCRSSRI